MELGKKFLEVDTVTAPFAEVAAAQARQVFGQYRVPSSEHLNALYEGLVKPEPIRLEPEPSPPIELPEYGLDEVGPNWAKVGAIATIAIGLATIALGLIALLSG